MLPDPSLGNDVTYVYFFPGQGSDERLFEKINLNASFQVVHVNYPIPKKGATMTEYAREISQQIDTTQKYIFIGVSLGGFKLAIPVRVGPGIVLLEVGSDVLPGGSDEEWGGALGNREGGTNRDIDTVVTVRAPHAIANPTKDSDPDHEQDCDEIVATEEAEHATHCARRFGEAKGKFTSAS